MGVGVKIAACIAILIVSAAVFTLLLLRDRLSFLKQYVAEVSPVQSGNTSESDGSCEQRLKVCASQINGADLPVELDALTAGKIKWTKPTPGLDASRHNLERELMFKDVLLVVSRVHFDKTKVLEHYHDFFWDMMYIVPQGNASERNQFLSSGLAVETCQEFNPYNGMRKDETWGWDFITFPCIAKIIGHLMGWQKITPAPPWESSKHQSAQQHLKGILVIHSDFWLTPLFGGGMDFSKVWALNNPDRVKEFKTHIRDATGDDWFRINCRSRRETNLVKGKWKRTRSDHAPYKDRKTGLWTKKHIWRPAQLPLRNASIVEMKRLQGLQELDFEERYCFGWVDAYYVPRSALETWFKVMQIVQHQKFLMNEIAVPIGFQALGYGGCVDDAQARTRCDFQQLKCWGACCVDGTLADVLQHPCGHRIDLRNSTLTTALTDMWQKHRAAPQTQLVNCFSNFNSCQRRR